MKSGTGVYVRTASGLVRQMSVADAAWYGVLATGGFVTLVYFWPFAHVALGGVSLPLVGVVALILGVPMVVTYAGLGSAMPRSGGDYMYQSRLLHPAVGFAFVMTCACLFWIVTFVLSSYTAGALFLSPLFTLTGYLWGNESLVALGNLVVQPAFLFGLLVVIGLLAYLNVAFGMKSYVKVQRYVLVPGLIVSHVTVLLLLGRASPESFVAAFNEWGQRMMQEPNLYERVVRAVSEAGYVVPAFSFRNTLFFATIPGAWLVYVVFAGQGLLGEVKGANSLRSLLGAFALPLIYVVFGVTALCMYLFERVVGWDFLHQLAYAQASGLVQPPFTPSFTVLVCMLTESPLIMFLATVACLGSAFYFAACCLLNCSRILLAMAFDRTLPEWLSRVSPRFRSPVNALTFEFLLAVIWGALWYFWPPFYFVVYSAASIAYVLILVPTGIAAALFPWTNPEIYRGAPISRWKLGSIPAITVFGAWQALASLGAVLTLSTVQELGAAGPLPLGVVFGLLAGAFVWFYAYKLYNARALGLDTGAAFRQIPPE